MFLVTIRLCFYFKMLLRAFVHSFFLLVSQLISTSFKRAVKCLNTGGS